MSQIMKQTTSIVLPEEIERRIAEYRRLGYEHQAMPHGIYDDPDVVCPWPGCGFRIAAVDFHIEKMGDPSLYKRAITAWWQGPGIVGRCPGCSNYVLFAIGKKQKVADPLTAGHVMLPDDWNQIAYIV